MDYLISSWCIFSVVTKKRVESGSGSGSGAGSQGGRALSEAHIREIITVEVVPIIRGKMPEIFGSIKTTMMEFFDDRYTTIFETAADVASTTVVAAGVGIGRVFQYRDVDIRSPLLLTEFRTQL